MTPLETILSRLPRYHQVGHGYRAKCPAHQGESANSLSLNEAEDGAALIYCYGSCDHVRILGAIGLEPKDLFPEGDVRRNGTWPKGGKCPRPKPPKTDEDKLILAFAAHHISGYLVD
jgi:hypothetical protein